MKNYDKYKQTQTNEFLMCNNMSLIQEIINKNDPRSEVNMLNEKYNSVAYDLENQNQEKERKRKENNTDQSNGCKSKNPTTNFNTNEVQKWWSVLWGIYVKSETE